MSRHTIFSAVALLAFAGASAAGAGEGSFSGSIAAEVRVFAETPAFGPQLQGDQTSFVLQPIYDWDSDDRRQQIRIEGFWRYDTEDRDRSHVDLREAWWRRFGDRFELLVGVNRVFWGVTESRHLVDVVNQSDLLERLDGEAKLGQPMLQLSTRGAWGRLSGFALLGFREREFPGEDGRLRPPLPVAPDAVYESSAGRRHVDLALRWSHSVGAWDLGVHGFHGTGREPRLVPEDGGGRLIPHYDITTQVGVDTQLTRGAWLGKLEALVRWGHGEPFGAAVVGFEHTRYQVFGTSADVGLLAELLWDGRDETAPPTPYDEDVFVGTRLALNDFQDTSVLVGGVVDLNDGSTLARFEAERRIGRGFSVELEARWFVHAADSAVLGPFDRDDYYSLNVARHF